MNRGTGTGIGILQNQFTTSEAGMQAPQKTALPPGTQLAQNGDKAVVVVYPESKYKPEGV